MNICFQQTPASVPSEAGARPRLLAVLERALDALPDHLAVLDEQANIIAVNSAWRRFGEANGLRHARSGLGLNYVAVCEAARGENSEEAPLVAANIRSLLAAGQGAFRCEYPCHSRTERRWFELHGSCFEEDSHRYLLLAHHPVTGIKEAEKAMEKKHQELVRSMQGLYYQVAHNFRAPLRATHGFGYLLLRNYLSRLDAQGQQFIRRILAASEQMNALIGGLLEYGHLGLEDARCAPTDTDEVVDHVIAALQHEVRRAAAEIQIHRPLPRVHADRRLLKRVLANLLTNALKFVPEGTTPRIRLWAELRPEAVQLNVQDNGIGMNPERIERIFEPFERLPDTHGYPGMGIGLAVAKTSMEKMGGRIGVESSPGQGSRFWLELKHGAAPALRA